MTGGEAEMGSSATEGRAETLAAVVTFSEKMAFLSSLCPWKPVWIAFCSFSSIFGLPPHAWET